MTRKVEAKIDLFESTAFKASVVIHVLLFLLLLAVAIPFLYLFFGFIFA